LFLPEAFLTASSLLPALLIALILSLARLFVRRLIASLITRALAALVGTLIAKGTLALTNFVQEILVDPRLAAGRLEQAFNARFQIVDGLVQRIERAFPARILIQA